MMNKEEWKTYGRGMIGKRSNGRIEKLRREDGIELKKAELGQV